MSQQHGIGMTRSRRIVTGVREHWKYQGARVPQGYHPDVDGKRCYWFRRENIGTGGTTLIIPVEKFWAAP